MKHATDAEIRDLVRRTTRAQGVTEKVEDRVQAAKLAVLINSARAATPRSDGPAT